MEGSDDSSAKKNWSKLRNMVKSGLMTQKEKPRLLELFEHSSTQHEKHLEHQYTISPERVVKIKSAVP